MQKKKAYFDKKHQTSEVTLGNLLEQNLNFEVETLMNQCYDLEEMCSQLQQNLSTDLQRQLPIVSPFSKYTLRKFFYTILTNYCLEFRGDMYTVRNPENGVYSGNTSEKEFEFQMYHKYLRPNAQLYGSYLTSNWPKWLFGQELPDI